MNRSKVSIDDLSTDLIELMRAEYESGVMSLGKLAKRENVSKTQLWRLAKREGWAKPSKEVITKEYIPPNPGGILDSVSVRKVKEIVEELGHLYSPVDEPLIVLYAKNYQRALRLEAVVDAEGESLVSPKTGALYPNPNYTALQAATANISRLGDRLGLSIASRKRLGLNFGTDESASNLFDFVDTISDVDVHELEI